MERTAREVAHAVLEALARGDHRTLSVMIDAEAAASFKRQQAEMLRHEEFLRSEKFLAEIPEEERQQWVDPHQSILRAAYAVDSLDDFDALPAREVVERFFRLKHGRAATHTGASDRPAEIVGEVRDGDDLVHVVFRRPPHLPRPRMTWDAVDVLTLRRRSEGWACALNGGLVYDSSGGFIVRMGSPDEPPELIDPL